MEAGGLQFKIFLGWVLYCALSGDQQRLWFYLLDASSIAVGHFTSGKQKYL